MHRADGPSVELVEASVVGCGCGIIAVEVPFVDEACSISRAAEYISEGGVLRQQVGPVDVGGVSLRRDLHARQAARRTLVVADTSVPVVFSRHEGASAGGADGRSGIAVGKACAAVGQFIDMRCADGLASVARQVAQSQVIGEDEHDVWGSMCLCISQLRNGGWEEGEGSEEETCHSAVSVAQ